uniref:Uncharacterized protein n=1 Tax=Mycena chlorophos TaxID=658473 RepID=A0ABQ0LM34_MYCCL|nr:predicted protein [Mycena chlorophos]
MQHDIRYFDERNARQRGGKISTNRGSSTHLYSDLDVSPSASPYRSSTPTASVSHSSAHKHHTHYTPAAQLYSSSTH